MLYTALKQQGPPDRFEAALYQPTEVKSSGVTKSTYVDYRKFIDRLISWKLIFAHISIVVVVVEETCLNALQKSFPPTSESTVLNILLKIATS